MKSCCEGMSIAANRIAGFGQSGAALVFSLVVLLILTILGVSALRTSALEQLMAGNTQELTRALEAADSGLGISFRNMPPDPAAFVVPATPYSFPSMNASATPAVPAALICGPPPRSTKPTANRVPYHEQRMVGRTVLTNARSALRQGFYVQGCPDDPTNPDKP